MLVVIDALMDLGGVATTGELRSAGIDRSVLDIAVMYRSVVRVRKGLWALPSLPRDVLVAKRVGGRVACVSALVLHELIDESPVAVHVEVPHNASRLRHAHSRVTLVVLHWTRDPVGSGRLVVPVAEAVRQFERCAAAQATNR